jgi:hypothetical protein
VEEEEELEGRKRRRKRTVDPAGGGDELATGEVEEEGRETHLMMICRRNCVWMHHITRRETKRASLRERKEGKKG